MTFSVNVDKVAADFFRKMVSEESKINDFVGLFLKDIEEEASSEESFKTMSLWQEFLKASVGDITHLTKDEISELNKAIRMNQVDSCSMVTQSLASKYYTVKSDAENKLYKVHSLFLPRMDKMV